MDGCASYFVDSVIDLDMFTSGAKASAEYFQKQHVPAAISSMLPDVRLIVSLRNPTDAFISKWLQTIKSDEKRVRDFETKTGRFAIEFREQQPKYRRLTCELSHVHMYVVHAGQANPLIATKYSMSTASTTSGAHCREAQRLVLIGTSNVK